MHFYAATGLDVNHSKDYHSVEFLFCCGPMCKATAVSEITIRWEVHCTAYHLLSIMHVKSLNTGTELLGQSI